MRFRDNNGTTKCVRLGNTSCNDMQRYVLMVSRFFGGCAIQCNSRRRLANVNSLTLNQRVPGSSPGAPTKKINKYNSLIGEDQNKWAQQIKADPMRTPPPRTAFALLKTTAAC